MTYGETCVLQSSTAAPASLGSIIVDQRLTTYSNCLSLVLMISHGAVVVVAVAVVVVVSSASTGLSRITHGEPWTAMVNDEELSGLIMVSNRTNSQGRGCHRTQTSSITAENSSAMVQHYLPTIH